MLTKNRIVMITLATLFAAQTAAYAQTADLSGTWKLDLSKSFLAGDHPRPGYELTKIISQKGSTETTINEIAIHPNLFGSTLPDTNTTTDYLVGQTITKMSGPCIFHSAPKEFAVTAAWQGGTLDIIEKGGCFGLATVEEHRYFLTADGSQLIELVTSHQTTGDSEQRYVYNKAN